MLPRMNLSRWLRSRATSWLLAGDRDGACMDACTRYVDRMLHQNDSDMQSNGERAFLARFCRARPHAVVFDVGANAGDWTSAVLGETPHARSHCFEPHPATFARLAERLRADPRVTLHPFGLSSAAGRASLHGVVADSGMSSLHRRDSVIDGRGLAEDSAVEVVLETLDDVVERLGVARIDLLKIDTEGHERSVLAGAARSLESGLIRTIQFEYGGTWIDARNFLIDVWRLLEGHGYRLSKIAPDGLVACGRYEPTYENFQYCNYVATLDP